MEELRSSEVLDREILEEARKEAHKILKTADNTLGVQTRDWDEKIKTALDSIKKNYAERIKKNEEEIFARLPLDKRRLRSETAERLLLKAMDDFLRSLSQEKLLSILERELAERLAAWAGDLRSPKVPGPELDRFSGSRAALAEVRYSGLSLCEVQDLLLKAPASEDWEIKEDAPDKSADSGLSAIHIFPSITINTQTTKITASAEAAAAALLKSKRAELAAALLGEGVLDD